MASAKWCCAKAARLNFQVSAVQDLPQNQERRSITSCFAYPPPAAQILNTLYLLLSFSSYFFQVNVEGKCRNPCPPKVSESSSSLSLKARQQRNFSWPVLGLRNRQAVKHIMGAVHPKRSKCICLTPEKLLMWMSFVAGTILPEVPALGY